MVSPHSILLPSNGKGGRSLTKFQLTRPSTDVIAQPTKYWSILPLTPINRFIRSTDQHLSFFYIVNKETEGENAKQQKPTRQINLPHKPSD